MSVLNHQQSQPYSTVYVEVADRLRTAVAALEATVLQFASQQRSTVAAVPSTTPQATDPKQRPVEHQSLQQLLAQCSPLDLTKRQRTAQSACDPALWDAAVLAHNRLRLLQRSRGIDLHQLEWAVPTDGDAGGGSQGRGVRSCAEAEFEGLAGDATGAVNSAAEAEGLQEAEAGLKMALDWAQRHGPSVASTHTTLTRLLTRIKKQLDDPVQWERVNAVLDYDPTYTPASMTEETQVWQQWVPKSVDQTSTASIPTPKGLQDVLALSDVNRQRYALLQQRWQAARQRYLSLVQTANERVCAGMLQLDEVEARLKQRPGGSVLPKE